jgi:hypothetical protein
MGPSGAVLKHLESLGADRGDDGRFIISGEPVTSGLGDELMVPDGTVYFIERRPHSLAMAMNKTDEGFGGFKVFERGPGYRPNPYVRPTNAEEAVRLFLAESGDELEGDAATAQYFEGPEGELILRLRYPGYFHEVLAGGHGTTTDDQFRETLRTMLRDVGMRGTWKQRKGKGKHRLWVFRPAERSENPSPEKHRRAYNAYVQSASVHLQSGADLLEKGQRQPAFRALRHAECDIRLAYTEAFYAKDDDEDLSKMAKPLEHLYTALQRQMAQLETRL